MSQQNKLPCTRRPCFDPYCDRPHIVVEEPVQDDEALAEMLGYWSDRSALFAPPLNDYEGPMPEDVK